eukprot:1349509-Alexandrium_andersonii.AAC.1
MHSHPELATSAKPASARPSAHVQRLNAHWLLQGRHRPPPDLKRQQIAAPSSNRAPAVAIVPWARSRALTSPRHPP